MEKVILKQIIKMYLVITIMKDKIIDNRNKSKKIYIQSINLNLLLDQVVILQKHSHKLINCIIIELMILINQLMKNIYIDLNLHQINFFLVLNGNLPLNLSKKYNNEILILYFD